VLRKQFVRRLFKIQTSVSSMFIKTGADSVPLGQNGVAASFAFIKTCELLRWDQYLSHLE
jgi:hypothetical protein